MTNKTTSAIDLVERVARSIFDAMHPTSDPVVREQYCQSSRYRNAARAAIEAQSDTITRLQAALEGYGAHKHWCKWVTTGDPKLAKCECGWLEKRREIRSSVGGE